MTSGRRWCLPRTSSKDVGARRGCLLTRFCVCVCVWWGTRRQKIVDFLEKKEVMRIVFYFDSKDQLTPDIDFPPNLKKKAVYFLKPTEMQVTKDNMTSLLRGDLAYTPVETVSSAVERVFLPLVDGHGNSVQWPAVVSGDVLHHTQDLKASSAIIAGQVGGKTLLPLPQGAESLPAADAGPDASREGLQSAILEVNKAVVHTIETAVIDWAHQGNWML